MISDLKITVLRRFHPDDVFGEDYPIKKLDWMRQCHVVEDGQEFIVHEMEMPEGFCSGAWTAIYPHLRARARVRGKHAGDGGGGRPGFV